MAKKKKPTKKATRKITIACEGAQLVPLKKLSPMQGDLKALTPDNHARLRNEIVNGGFSEPITIWRQGKKWHILNGHQRLEVLHALEKDGYEIPPLPVYVVEAKDEREAREKLLGLASQYGRVDEEGLDAFLKKSKLDTEEAARRFRFSEVNVELLGIEGPSLPPPLVTGDDDRTHSIIVYYATDEERRQIAALLNIDEDRVVHRLDEE
jgi:hypothetical protein